MAKRELTLGGHRVERVLGGGGSAEVLLARSPSGETVAVKRLLPRLAGDPRAAELFALEAELTEALAHSGIARVLERHDDYFVMEYLAGATLAERAPRESSEVMALGAAIAGVLAHVHACGVIHRDVCPDNVVVTASGRVVLLDFGVAHKLGDRRSLPSGLALGTAAYVAPEQLLGAPLDGRADVFSLAALLWELVTGRRLFRRVTDAATLLAVAEAPVPRSSELAAGAPEAFIRVIERALERDPNQRPTAADLARALTAR
jgi:serine/threonine-protein kinase